ncbi:hypothetical protein [Wolbachia endosymbiont of Folsomia candida]|uniref:hypothetical protein n=1 Tax=Wolbachia endosymbiont of Folsomia candida TaxID=169402 RepID=UPI000A5EB49F|nr:hypothetical protein [Wolbachia endosymbiont of Folsomia candida]APR98314.2 hypothetical protein ASM33_03355 [Wolbachia endosymbiont of Folsomia candida]
MLNFLQRHFKINEKLTVIQWLLSQPSPLSSQPLSMSFQCVTLGSTLLALLLTYTPRIRCSLHDLQIFLYLDPSVTHWDDRKKRHWDDIEKTHFGDMERRIWDEREREHWDEIERRHCDGTEKRYWYDKRGVL